MKTTLSNTTEAQKSTLNMHNRKMIDTYAIQVSMLSEKDGGGFQALYPPLARSVVGYGATTQEAIDELQIMVPTFLHMMDKTSQSLPEIAIEKNCEEYSGKFNVRVAKVLHAQLVELAEEQGVSLNSMVQTLLASGATSLAAGKMFGTKEHAKTRQKVSDQWIEGNTQFSTFQPDKFLVQERALLTGSLVIKGH